MRNLYSYTNSGREKWIPFQNAVFKQEKIYHLHTHRVLLSLAERLLTILKTFTNILRRVIQSLLFQTEVPYSDLVI